MQKLRPALAIALLATGCGQRPPTGGEHGDSSTPVPVTAQDAGGPAATAASYAKALLAGEPIEPWSTPGWAAEVATGVSSTGAAPVVVTGQVLERATATTADVTVTTDPPEAQLRVLLVLRSGAWLVRGHG